MLRLWRMIRATGRIAEPAPPPPALSPGAVQVAQAERASRSDAERPGVATEASAGTRDAGAIIRALGGSVQVRHVDAGSCNGCEVEIGAAFGPVYDAERYGARLVASPRHADALMVTGVVTRNMAEPLRRTYAAVPAPKLVLAVGDCARNCGVFAGAYGVTGAARDVVPVDAEVPGCPPRPEAIVAALRELTGR